MSSVSFGMVVMIALLCSVAKAEVPASRSLITFEGRFDPRSGAGSMAVSGGRMGFALRQGHLVFDPLWFGPVSGKVDIDLTGSRQINVSLDVLSADLGMFLDLLRERGIEAPLLSGVVTGSLQLKGSMERPYITGRLSAYNGRLQGFAYETFDVKFEGAYPRLWLEDGMVVSLDGPRFKVAGALDLSDMDRSGRQLKRDLVISDDDSGRAWVFRRLQGAGGHTTQLRSFLGGNADGRGEGNGVIGLQKHIGF